MCDKCYHKIYPQADKAEQELHNALMKGDVPKSFYWSGYKEAITAVLAEL